MSSVMMPSQTWGDMCPADLALLGNFKVKEEGKNGPVSSVRSGTVSEEDIRCVFVDI